MVGIVGSPQRPDAVVVQLPDGTRAVTFPRLDAVQAWQVAATVADRTGAARRWDPGLEVDVVAVADGPVAEVRAGTTRYAIVALARLRPCGL